MNRASLAWAESNVALLRRFLEKQLPRPGLPDLRGTEWYLLWRLAHSAKVISKSGPFVAFSPDGQTVGFTGGSNPHGHTVLWNYRLGRELGKLPKSYGRDIAFSADGKQFAVAEYNDSLAIYETQSLRLVTKLPFTVVGRWTEQSRSIVRFSPDHRTLAFIAAGDPGTISGVYNYTIRLWNMSGTSGIVTLPNSENTNSLDFSSDGTTLVATSRLSGVRLWNLAVTPPVSSPWPLSKPPGSLRVARLSPDGTMLAVAFEDGVTVWDVRSKKELLSVSAPAPLADVAFSPDGRRIAMACANRTMPVHEVPSGKLVGVARGFGQTAESAAFSPDGRFLAGGSHEASASVWDMTSIEAQQPVSAGAIEALSFRGDGQAVMVGGARYASLHAVPSRETMSRFPREETERATGVSVSSDGSVTAVSTVLGEVRVYRSGHPDPVLGLRRPVRGVIYRDVIVRVGSFAVTSRDGRTLVTGHEGGAASVIDLRTNRLAAVLGDPKDTMFAGEFSRDGSLLALVGWHTYQKEADQPITHIGVWETGSWKKRFHIASNEDVSNYVAISPDKRSVATYDLLNVLSLRNMAGQVTQRLTGSLNTVRCLAYSPDGKRIIACDDRHIHFWDLATGQSVASLRMDNRVMSAAFSPDGRTLAVGDAAGRLLYLDATPPQAGR